VPETQTYRLFIALSVPEEVKDQLRRAQSELRARLQNDPVRWTRPEQIHLTLKFLGEVAVERVDELVKSVRSECDPVGSFKLTARGIGFFPNARRPRVIWVGIENESGQLEKLQDKMDRCTSDFAASRKEEHFSAHLTLGRIKDIRPNDARSVEASAVGMSGRTFGSWTVSNVKIMRSELTSQGSLYSCVVKIPLKS
jgi:2'-5' RNA ligase